MITAPDIALVRRLGRVHAHCVCGWDGADRDVCVLNGYELARADAERHIDEHLMAAANTAETP